MEIVTLLETTEKANRLYCNTSSVVLVCVTELTINIIINGLILQLITSSNTEAPKHPVSSTFCVCLVCKGGGGRGRTSGGKDRKRGSKNSLFNFLVK